ARISELALDQSFNFFPQGLAQALTMIFSAALLHTPPLNKTDEDIRNCRCRLVKGMMPGISFLVGHSGCLLGR
ncbi:MAG TPA: hypothetical protein VH024_16890, partial [Candidatus Angelobacter sp.]|nr:hypothetical protein [Candidatus Angelobacter sp.]